MGAAAAADTRLIPPVVGLDHPGYLYGTGQIDYAAAARLINDNLLDLSHVSFLHTASFRMSETWARERPRVSQCDRGVRSERWIRSEGVLGAVDTQEVVDTYFCYEFFVPGVLLMAVRTYPVGTANALNGQSPDLHQAAEEFTSQAVTPLMDKTARYFYVMGRRPCGAETAYDMTTAEKAFAEDKTMIEAQQRNIDVTPKWRFAPTTADRGILLFSRLVEKLLHEETAQVSRTSLESSHLQVESGSPYSD